MDKKYTTFRIDPINGNDQALRLTISNPPINLITYTFLYEFHTYLLHVSTLSSPPKVLVISSSNTHFWLSHLDLHIASKDHPLPPHQDAGKAIHALGSTLSLFSSLSTIFIAEINGRAIAGGNEFALNMDMRFAGPNAKFGIVEVGGGLIHVGALQQLTKLIGAGRAAEYMLGAKGVDAKTAERIGWVNEAFETEEGLRAYVDGLAVRIASFPREGIKFTKMGIRECLEGTGNVGKDLERFKELIGREETQFAIGKLLEMGGDTELGEEFELGLPETVVDVWAKSLKELDNVVVRSRVD